MSSQTSTRTSANIPRRSRLRPKATTGIIGITDNDKRGLFEPLSRYGYLPTNHLLPFDGRYHKHMRLTDFFQETADWKAKDKPILRYVDPDHWSVNSQAKYTRGPAVYKFLEATEDMQRVIDASIIGPLPDPHDMALSISVARIEHAAKKAGVPFINHLHILSKKEAADAFAADKPLHIPIDAGIAWNMKGGYVKTEKTALAPDALFGLKYPQGTRFFAVEYDRGGETEIPTRDLKRRSWLRKVLCYQAVSKGLLEKHLGIPKMYCLVIAKSEDRRQGILRAVKHVFSAGTDLIAVAVAEPIRVYGTIPPPDDHLFTTEWQRVGHPTLKLNQI